MDSFEVIGVGERVSARKPAPDIYYWVLTRLHLEALARRQ
jgi:beta-phosphoglucomutase-like phosphatase (HAD superfamily)